MPAENDIMKVAGIQKMKQRYQDVSKNEEKCGENTSRYGVRKQQSKDVFSVWLERFN